MIRVGTCGFSYREWVGPFYPRGVSQSDFIAYYAERFDTVEIDSTYYATPGPELFERLDRRTPPTFRFTVKAPSAITHLPAEVEPAEDEAMRFAACVEPIRASKKLGAILAQFPNGFRPSPAAYRRIESLRKAWPHAPIVVEFRHRDWQKPDVLRRLTALNLGWCNVDEPSHDTLLRPGAHVTSDLGYVRFHGRNAAAWWHHDKPSDRYSYLYNDAELAEWVPLIEQVADKTRETYVFFNNHANGQSAINARQMAALLDVALAVPAVSAVDPRLKLFD
jgi:uncharacterized protein YecE (DUF72 family)